MKWFSRNYPSRFSFLVAHFLPSRILDAGNIGGLAGNALSYSIHLRFRKYLEKKCPNAELIGFDLFRPAKQPHRYLSQVQGSIYHAPFPEETFDTIYMGELLEHLQTPYNTLVARAAIECDDTTFPAYQKARRHGKSGPPRQVGLSDLQLFKQLGSRHSGRQGKFEAVEGPRPSPATPGRRPRRSR